MRRESEILMKFEELEKRIGYDFADRKLLERSLTHLSWAHDRIGSAQVKTVLHRHNETLEFIGDAVIGLAVAEFLYRKHQNADEGEMTLMKHRAVSTKTLAEAAAELSLGDFVRLGRGEEKNGGKRKRALLADTFEAVIGAVFLDSDYETAKKVIWRLLNTELNSLTPENANDYKTILQEKMQAQKKEIPQYEVIKREGEAHNLTFYVRVAFDGGTAEGVGKSIKSAAQNAAFQAVSDIAARESGS